MRPALYPITELISRLFLGVKHGACALMPLNQRVRVQAPGGSPISQIRSGSCRIVPPLSHNAATGHQASKPEASSLAYKHLLLISPAGWVPFQTQKWVPLSRAINITNLSQAFSILS